MSPPTTDAGSLVPSSQSDETEVTLAPQKIVNVDHWRKQALPISPDLNLDFTGDQMEVDVPETFHSAADPVVRVMDNTPKGSFTSAFEQMLTPPLTERLSDEPLPSSPVILDPDTKAAKIIAEIKAKAIASVISSPELLPSLDLDESPDDSSDEEEMTFSHFNKKVGTMIQRCPLFNHAILSSNPFICIVRRSRSGWRAPQVVAMIYETAPLRRAVLLREISRLCSGGAHGRLLETFLKSRS